MIALKIILTFIITIYLCEYVYFKRIIVHSLQPAITRVFVVRVLLYLVISFLAILSLIYSYQYSNYFFYPITLIYLVYFLSRYSFQRKETNILKILKDYRKFDFLNRVRVIKGMPELDMEEKLRLTSLWYFRRWKFDEISSKINVDLIFDSDVKPGNVKELISLIFLHGHLANNELYHSLSYDIDKLVEESDLIDRLYDKVFEIKPGRNN